MGIQGYSTNKKRLRVSSSKLGKIKRMDKKKRNMIVGEIMDPDIITAAHLRKRRTSQRANITLSGKKKRKIIKQLKRLQKSSSGMDVELDVEEAGSSEVRDIEMSNPPKQKGQKKKKSKKKTTENQSSEDMEMDDES